MILPELLDQLLNTVFVRGAKPTVVHGFRPPVVRWEYGVPLPEMLWWSFFKRLPPNSASRAVVGCWKKIKDMEASRKYVTEM